eukprot:scaffold76423_cov63-Phaeocystis_antarctica.AAC.1
MKLFFKPKTRSARRRRGGAACPTTRKRFLGAASENPRYVMQWLSQHVNRKLHGLQAPNQTTQETQTPLFSRPRLAARDPACLVEMV